MFCVSSHIYPEVELVIHKAVSFLTFWGTSILFYIVAAPIWISTNSTWGFPFPRILASTCCLLIYRWQPFWPVWGDVSLWFQFVYHWWLVVLSIFHTSLSHLCFSSAPSLTASQTPQHSNCAPAIHRPWSLNRSLPAPAVLSRCYLHWDLCLVWRLCWSGNPVTRWLGTDPYLHGSSSLFLDVTLIISSLMYSHELSCYQAIATLSFFDVIFYRRLSRSLKF